MSSASEQVRINAPPSHHGLGWGNVRNHVRELWQHRALLWALVLRETKARYRNSALGYLWTFLNPLLLLGVYSLVFSVYMRVDLPDYAIYLFAALLPWIWLSSSLTVGTTCIVQGGSLIAKALLPPQLLPLMHVINNLVNMVLGLPVLLLAATLVGRPPHPALVVLPVLLLGHAMLIQGLVLITSSLCVRFRDMEFLVTNGLNLWFFLTPIVYAITMIPERFRALALLNPATPITLAIQDIVYWRRFPAPLHVGLSLGMGAIALFVGIQVFERLRDHMAEEI
ncbi:MAG: ABC transporter permease [Planctomycetota bacterium]|nr:MAG: ABC transporter permease [Planctomycetota bacterium]